jgi:hypothetical protein
MFAVVRSRVRNFVRPISEFKNFEKFEATRLVLYLKREKRKMASDGCCPTGRGNWDWNEPRKMVDQTSNFD